MRYIMKFGVVAIMSTIIMLGGVACTPDNTGTATPTVTVNTETGAPVMTPSAPISTLYNRCVMIASEQGRIYEKDAAEQFYRFISNSLETVRTDTVESNPDPEALYVYIGQTEAAYSVEQWQKYNQDGYMISAKDNSLVLRGSSAENTYTAVSRFVNEMLQNNADNISNLDMENGVWVEKAAVSREEYIADISLFEPVWQYEWQAPEWILDFENKLVAFTSRLGRPICYAHRGDLESYPENSIEAVISAVKRGADLIEIDAYMTRDKVLVLMHNTDLSVTTDWILKRGETINGVKLPTSNNLTQWTYEQLSHLNLRTGNGKYAEADSEITEYKIPTLEEVFMVCNERSLLVIDRLNSSYWDKVYEIIKKTKAYRCFTYTIMAENVVQANQYRDLMLQEVGAAAPTCFERGYAWSGDHYAEFDLETDAEFGAYYRQQFLKGCFIATNRVSRLIDYLDQYYSPTALGK